MSETDEPVVPHLRNLGYFDAPQLIQCRRCHTLKKAHNANFRNIRGKADRFRFTCRNCERKTAYARTVDAKINAIRNRPGLTDEERAVLILGDGTPLRPGLLEQVSEQRKAKLRRARLVHVDDTFRQSWTEVRKAVAARRVDLDQRIRANRAYNAKYGSQTGVAYCMAVHPQCERYMRLVLATYSSVVARLRNLDEWRKVVDGHMPPRHWLDAITGKAGKLSVSPFEFTTREERRALRLADPAKVDGPCSADWQFMVANTGRANGAMQYHVYPLWLPSGKTIAQMSPPWLLAFNQADKE